MISVCFSVRCSPLICLCFKCAAITCMLPFLIIGNTVTLCIWEIIWKCILFYCLWYIFWLVCFIFISWWFSLMLWIKHAINFLKPWLNHRTEHQKFICLISIYIYWIKEAVLYLSNVFAGNLPSISRSSNLAIQHKKYKIISNAAYFSGVLV